MSNSKEQRYRELIASVKEKYASDGDLPHKLYWFDDCDEINLWTYWQGRNHLDAEILLVGQDWGNPWDSSCAGFREKLSHVGSGPIENYMENNDSITDNNLKALFQECLNIDISKPCPNVFFTNYILGYREGKISGGYRAAWAKHDREFFRQLVEIMEPKVILCLGRNVFEAVLMSWGQKPMPRIKRYNDYLDHQDKPQIIKLQNQTEVSVFALAHCGAMGTMNRNRGYADAQTDKLTLQKKDWGMIQNIRIRG